jgi:chromosome segregation protein
VSQRFLKLFSQLEKARSDLGQATERLAQIRSKRESLSEKLTEWTQKKQTDETELEILTKKYTELNRVVAETSRDLAGLKQIKMNLGERSGTLAQELAENEARINREQADLETLREELLQKKSRLSSLEELERNFEGFQDGPRTLLTRKRGGDIDSIVGAVADLIETQPRFEGAVTAVLGERMQALVVKTTDDGAVCAQYLKSTQTGRSTFLPLLLSEDRVHDSSLLVRELVPAATTRISGYHGLISDVVRVLPEHQSLKKVLFGDVVLVEELSQAMEYWNQSRSAVVTFDGEMISREGILTGGTVEHTSKALLEKKREIKELDVMVMELVDRVRARSETCADLSRKIQTLKSELEDMRSSGHQEEIKIASQEKDITHLAKEREVLNTRRGLLAQQVFETAESLDKMSLQLTQFEKDEIYYTELETEARNILTMKKPQEETLRAELSACHESLTREKISQARLIEQKTFLELELDRLMDEKTRHARNGIHFAEHCLYLIKQRLFLEDVCVSLERQILR